VIERGTARSLAFRLEHGLAANLAKTYKVELQKRYCEPKGFPSPSLAVAKRATPPKRALSDGEKLPETGAIELHPIPNIHVSRSDD